MSVQVLGRYLHHECYLPTGTLAAKHLCLSAQTYDCENVLVDTCSTAIESHLDLLVTNAYSVLCQRMLIPKDLYVNAQVTMFM